MHSHTVEYTPTLAWIRPNQATLTTTLEQILTAQPQPHSSFFFFFFFLTKNLYFYLSKEHLCFYHLRLWEISCISNVLSLSEMLSDVTGSWEKYMSGLNSLNYRQEATTKHLKQTKHSQIVRADATIHIDLSSVQVFTSSFTSKATNTTQPLLLLLWHFQCEVSKCSSQRTYRRRLQVYVSAHSVPAINHVRPSPSQLDLQSCQWWKVYGASWLSPVHSFSWWNKLDE